MLDTLEKEVVKNMKPLPVNFTEDQRSFLDEEARRTGESVASLVRGFVREKMDAKPEPVTAS